MKKNVPSEFLKLKTLTQFPMTLNACCIVIALFGCACGKLVSLKKTSRQAINFPSLTYGHFEKGVLFTDVVTGLDVLWNASFSHGSRVYKENLGFLVPEGLLVLPNKNNTPKSARLNALPIKVENNRLFVLFEDSYLPVLGIVHSHPDVYAMPLPTPGKDYQYSYLGISNYVIDHRNIYNAYKDVHGNERFEIIAQRRMYEKIPATCCKNYPNDSITINRMSNHFSVSIALSY